MQVRFAFPLTALALCLALPSQAQWYVGAAAGKSQAQDRRADRDEQFLDLGFAAASTSRDDKDRAYRLYGGYRFHRYAAAELGFVDLGRFEDRTAVLPAGTFSTRLRVQGVDLSVLGLLPVGERFTLFARLGVLESRNRTSISGSGSVMLLPQGSQSERRTGAVYGIGAMANLNSRVGVRLEWAQHDKLGDELGGRFKARTLTAGVQAVF